MNRDQFIDDLLDKGYSPEEITEKLDKEFPADQGPTDPPKKKQDPVKTETDMGSKENTVSSSEDGSLDLSNVNYSFDEYDSPAYKALSDRGKENQDLLNPQPGDEIVRIEEVEITKPSPKSIEEELVAKLGNKIYHGGDWSSKFNFYANAKMYLDPNRFYIPGADFTEKKFIEQKNRNFFQKTWDAAGGLFGNTSGNLANTENLVDQEGFRDAESKNRIIGSDELIFDYSGIDPDNIYDTPEDIAKRKQDSEFSEVPYWQGTIDKDKRKNATVISLARMRKMFSESLAQEEYNNGIKKIGGVDKYSEWAFSQGDKFLTEDELKYSEASRIYRNPNSTADQKLQAKATMDELSDVLDGGGKLLDKKGDLNDPAYKVQAKYASQVNQEAKDLSERNTEQELRALLSKRYAKVIALGKDYSKYIENLGSVLQGDPSLVEDLKSDFKGPGRAEYAATLSVAKRAFGDVNKNINDLNSILLNGELPEGMNFMIGDHPYAVDFNKALSEYYAINKALKLNVNPLSTKKDGFVSGFYEGFNDVVKNTTGITLGQTSDIWAENFANVINSGDQQIIDHKKINERLKRTWSNGMGLQTFDLTMLVAELGATKKLPIGRILSGTKTGLNIAKEAAIAKYSVKIPKSLDAVYKIGINAAYEGELFKQQTKAFGGGIKEQEEAQAFGFFMGAGNELASAVGKNITKKLLKNKITAKAYNYYTVQRQSQAIGGAITGSALMNIYSAVSEGMPKNQDGSIDGSMLLSNVLDEALKLYLVGRMSYVPNNLKAFSRETARDLYQLAGKDKVSLDAAKNLNIDYEIVDKTQEKGLETIEQARKTKIQEIKSSFDSGNITREKANEEIDKANKSALDLNNKYEINNFAKNKELEANNKFALNDNNGVDIAMKIMDGEKLTPTESIIAADATAAELMSYLGANGKRMLDSEGSLSFIESIISREKEINNILDSSPKYKTQSDSKERQQAYDIVSEAFDIQLSIQRISGKEKPSDNDKAKIQDLKNRLEELTNGKINKRLQEVLDLHTKKRYQADIDQQRKILEGTKQGELVEVESEKEFSDKYQQIKGTALSEDFNTFGFYDSASKKYYINKELALKQRKVTTGNHEGLHFVLRDALKYKEDNREKGQVKGEITEEGIKIIDNVLDQLSPKQRRIIEDKINLNYLRNDRGQFRSKASYYEEYLTALSESIAEKKIQFNEDIGSALTPMFFELKENGLDNLELNENTGKDLFNFIKSYASGDVDMAIKMAESTEEKIQKPKAIFMVGGPGAGKTNIGKGLKLGRRGFKVVNQDIALESMKEEAGLPAEEANYTAEQRSLRSSLGNKAVEAAKNKFDKYMSNKNDMVIDGTGASYNATTKKIKALEEAGFDVYMVAANTSKEVAVDRNKARKERSLPDKIVEKSYDQVQESLAKYREDFGDRLYEINTEDIKLAEDLPQEFLNKFYKGIGVEDRDVAYSKERKTEEDKIEEKELFEEILDSIEKEDLNLQTNEEFKNSQTYSNILIQLYSENTKLSNQIKKPFRGNRRLDSLDERISGYYEEKIDQIRENVLIRLNRQFDPSKTKIGMEGLLKSLMSYIKFERAKVINEIIEDPTIESINKPTAKEIEDIKVDEASFEESRVEVTEKEKPSISPLKFIGVPEKLTLSDKPGKGLTLKNVGKKYAGEVGEQIFKIPAKKIMDPSANLASMSDAKAIQFFFSKGDNFEKLLKILPEYNIALPVTKLGLEKLDTSREVQGTGLGIPKKIQDRLYRGVVEEGLTSPKGRSKGLTSQVPVKKLMPEFRGVIPTETINKLKQEIGITPKGELNVLPKGDLRSSVGQLLKGYAKLYSTLAANTLVRQELQKAGATKQEIADVAGGKRDVMLSKEKKKESKEDLDFDLIKELATARSFKNALKALEKKGFKVGNIDEIKDIELTQKEIEEIIVEAGVTSDEFKITKFTNFGVNTVYGEFKNGVFREFSKKEKEAKGKEKLKYKYYALKNNQYEKVPIKRNPKGELIEDRKKADIIKKSRPDDFLPGRSDIYYGVEDPAYKRALKLASNNSTKDKKARRVKAQFAGTKAGNEQFKINIEALEKMTVKLADAVHNKGVSVETAIKFITKAYQATEGLIKISAPIKYASAKPKYAGQYGKRNQNEGELFREEHTVPASTVGGYLIYAVHANAAKPIMDIIKKNYFQVLLGKQYDVILDKAKLDASLAEGYTIYDDPAIRMLTANILTESIKDLPRMDFNDQINLETGKSWAEEIGVVLPKEYITIDNLNLQNRLLLDVVTGKKTAAENQKYLNEHVKIEGHKAAEFNNKNLKGVVSASREKKPSNKQIITELSNREKALKNAKDPKAPVKGITVFDFDDTLATSKSLVGVEMPDGEVFKIDATEFARRGDALLAQGAEFDFSDFSKVVDGKPGPLISKLEKAINKFGSKDVFVLTARPANSASAIHEFLKSLGYEVPLENITGLANSSPEAKADWMVEKAANGYNDFYFVDDAYKNVKAVQDAMSVLDVKSKESIVYKDRFEKLDKEFNDILENKTGIASEKEYSDAKAEVVGVDKGKFNFFISPSAEDFVGLLYSTLGKGKLGENQMAWYKKNLLDPYTRAMNNISNERMALAADYKALKKQLGVVPRKLRDKIKGEGFTQEQAVRIYIWNKQGMEVPGLSKTDLAEMTKYVQNNPKLNVFADQLVEITKGDGYAMPFENWMTGSITTDLLSTLQVTKRAKHLEEWQRNIDVIFSKKNLNKLEAAYGSTYRKAMENMLQRMKTGKNRGYDGDSLTGRFLDWVNGSTGAIMFFNTRSAMLQTISAINFVNWSDNNIFKASAAFANQPQYWKDFKELFMSDFLRERRDNLTININESDIAEMANKGGVRGAIGYILQKGFLPTQFADGFAIASGGATFYRNRINTYMKEGLSEKEAKEKAFNDFRELTEESQQSSRPDRISQQQAGPLGRIVLAFANTPSQYARIIKKATLDLTNNRGDFKTNLSKIMYYSVIQGVIFNALQSALFAADFDDEEEMSDRTFRMGNSIVDGILRGTGVQGAVTSVVKNATLKALEESEKNRPKYDKVVNEIIRISPPISSKVSKLQQAAREIEWNKKEMKSMGWSLDNPAWIASANVISATTNIPADRVIKKINNITYATTQDLELYERLALLGGWQKWELGLTKKEAEKKKKTISELRSKSKGTYIDVNKGYIDLDKGNYIDINK